MRVTSKGQVTIPQHIRERAGIAPGTEVDFAYEGRVVVLRKAKQGRRPTRGEAIVHRLRGSAIGKLRMTTDEIMALTRGDEDGLERLRQLRAAKTRNPVPVKDQIMAISRRAGRLPRRTNLTPEEIIGYDERGLPR